MVGDWLRSRGAVWCLLCALHAVALGGGVFVAGYALIPLRAEKMEVIYRTEGVPFAAGPGGVPADKWRRMTAIDLEIVEPLANWILGVAVAFVVVSAVSLCLLSRLSPIAAPGPDAPAKSDAAAGQPGHVGS